jgi:alkylated DNA repair protein alkB family protein 6
LNEDCFILQPHQDGPSYFPVVAILSLGSPVVMDFTPHARLKLDSQEVIDKESDGETIETGKEKWIDDHHPFSIILMPRSLLIFKDKAYSGKVINCSQVAIINHYIYLVIE